MKIDGLSPLPFRLNDLIRVKKDIEFQRIISGKYNVVYEFRPVGKKTSGSAIGNLYEKFHTKPKIPKEGSNEFPLKRWLGKINAMSANNCGLFSSQPKVGSSYLNETIRTEKDLNSAAIIEYLGNSLYRLLSDSSFETPKMRLARLPIMNEYLKDHLIAEYYSEELELKSCYRVMCKWSEDYKDLKDLKVNYNFMILPFMSVILDYGIVPQRVIDPENPKNEVDIEGLMGVLACSTSLGDVDCLGVSGKNCGYIIERNEKSKEIDRIRIVKIDPGMCFYFSMIRKHGLKSVKDILFCSNYDNRGISWNKLSKNQKFEFLEVKLHHLDILKDIRILKYLFFRKYFGTNENYKTSEKKLKILLGDFIKHVEQEILLLKDDVDQYINSVKRIKYLKVRASYFGDFDRNLLYYEKLISLSSLLTKEEHHKFLNGCGYIENDRGNYDKAINYIQMGLNIGETSESCVATSYECLGGIYRSKGEYDKAKKYYEKSLKIQEKTLPSNHPDIASSYNNLGNVYLSKGEYDKAIEYYEKCLKLQEKSVPSIHPDIASSYNNLGNVYVDKGEYDKAKEYFEKSLKIWEKTLPSNHPDIANSYNNLGNVYYNKGENDKAKEYYEKSLKIREKSLSSNHPSIGDCNSCLGNVYGNKGEYDKAIEYYEKSLKIREKSLPSNHPSISESYNNLGNVYSDKGEYDRAIECYEKSLKIEEKSLPSNHPYIGDSYICLGVVYFNKGEYDKAKGFYEKSLRIYVKSGFPTTHPRISMVKGNMNILEQKMKELRKS